MMTGLIWKDKPMTKLTKDQQHFIDTSYFHMIEKYEEFEEDYEDDMPDFVCDLMSDMVWHIQYLTQLLMEGKATGPNHAKDGEYYNG